MDMKPERKEQVLKNRLSTKKYLRKRRVRIQHMEMDAFSISILYIDL